MAINFSSFDAYLFASLLLLFVDAKLRRNTATLVRWRNLENLPTPLPMHHLIEWDSNGLIEREERGVPRRCVSGI